MIGGGSGGRQGAVLIRQPIGVRTQTNGLNNHTKAPKNHTLKMHKFDAITV